MQGGRPQSRPLLASPETGPKVVPTGGPQSKGVLLRFNMGPKGEGKGPEEGACPIEHLPGDTHTHTLAEPQNLTQFLLGEPVGTAGWKTGGGLRAIERDQCKRMEKGARVMHSQSVRWKADIRFRDHASHPPLKP